MLYTSKRTLKWPAALVWIVGGIVLLRKANSLLSVLFPNKRSAHS